MSARDTLERSHRFTIAPEHLILDPRVNDRAFRLWCRLDRFAGDKAAAFPSRETLSIELDCSLASVDRALQELVAACWLDKRQTGPGGGNSYRLLAVPEAAVLALIEGARTERQTRWAGQRTRQRRAARDRKAQVGAGVPTRDDTPGGESVVTRDAQVSSPVTPSVVTGDAQKEATRSENQGKETNPGTPLRDAPAQESDADVLPFDAPAGGRRPKPPEIQAAEVLARGIVTQYMNWWKRDRGLTDAHPIPDGERVFHALVGAKATRSGCSYVTLAILQGYTRDQVALALGRWASPPGGRQRPQGLQPTKAAWTETLAAIAAGRDVPPMGGAPRESTADRRVNDALDLARQLHAEETGAQALAIGGGA